MPRNPCNHDGDIKIAADKLIDRGVFNKSSEEFNNSPGHQFCQQKTAATQKLPKKVAKHHNNGIQPGIDVIDDFTRSIINFCKKLRIVVSLST